MTNEEVGKQFVEALEREERLEKCLKALEAKHKRFAKDAVYVLQGCEEYFKFQGQGARGLPEFDKWPDREEFRLAMNQHNEMSTEMKKITKILAPFRKGEKQ